MASLKACLLTMTALLLAAPAVSAHRVVPVPFQKRALTRTLTKRSTFEATLNNYIPLGEYFATVAVGTPPQYLELVIDTGSSDIWFFGPDACNVQAAGGACEGGSFDPTQSSTYLLLYTDLFSIQYETANSGVAGNYIADNFGIGDITVTNITMAVATSANQTTTGIMGIALDVDESIAAQSDEQDKYANLPDVLVTQGKIGSKAYSLYLDNLASGSGTVLFGGYDTAKFSGDIIMLPLQTDAESGIIDSFAVAWTSFGITDVNGTYLLETTDLPAAAILDSGTTLTYLPQDLFYVVANFLGAVSDPNFGYVVSCDIATTTPGTLDYGFGGTNGPLIAVDFAELAVPVYDLTGQRAFGSNGEPVCSLGIMPNTVGDPILFGQTFLRSAYVLYDLDNLAAGLAPTIFDVTTPNIVEYHASSSNPSVTTDTTGPTITVASVVDNPGGPYSSILSSASVNTFFSTSGVGVLGSSVFSGSVTSVISTDLSITRSYPTSVMLATSEAASLTAQTGTAAGVTVATGTGTGTASSGSTSTAAAVAGSVPKVGMAVAWGVLGTMGMMLLGGLLLV